MTKKEYTTVFRDNEQPSLFDRAEMYRASHTKAGISYAFEQLSSTERRRLKLDNMHLLPEMRFTQTYGLPIVEPYRGPLQFTFAAYSNRSKHPSNTTALHFFGGDEKILPTTWYNIDRTTANLIDYPLVIGPDSSLFVDAPFAYNLTSVYRSRFSTAHWQCCGIPTVPLFSFADANSLKYCLDGFPEDSVVALTGVGHESHVGSEKLWHYCVGKMIEEKHPRTLIIYGGTEEKYNILGVSVLYIPDHIHTNLRKL